MEDNMTYEERANFDKLDFYWKEKIKVHLILKRTNENGKHIFLNGSIKEKINDRLWVIEEKVLGEVRVSISEILNDGVFEMEEKK